MSFTTDIKQELCRITDGEEEALAECLGMLLFAGQLSREQLRIQCEMTAVRRRIQTLFRQCFGVCPEEEDHVLFLCEKEALDRIFLIYGYEKDPTLPLNLAVVEEEACKNAFLRGAFLVGGYVSAPEKGYHLELVTNRFHVSRQVSAFLNEMELPAGRITRRGISVLYYKDSSAIEDFLSAAGATGSAMDLMLKKVERDLRNQVNRKVNCETANLTKTVGAAARQMAAIQAIREGGRFDTLSAPLKEAAELRTRYPDLSLSELCRKAETPISRPGLNNRLRRLVELGEEPS